MKVNINELKHYVIVETKAQSEQLQRLFFAAGGAWNDRSTVIRSTHGKYMEFIGTKIFATGNKNMLARTSLPVLFADMVKLLTPEEEVKEFTVESLANTKIWVGGDATLAKRVQEKLFSMGIGWNSGGQKLVGRNFDYILVIKGTGLRFRTYLNHGDGRINFDSYNEYTEVLAEQLLAEPKESSSGFTTKESLYQHKVKLVDPADEIKLRAIVTRVGLELPTKLNFPAYVYIREGYGVLVDTAPHSWNAEPYKNYTEILLVDSAKVAPEVVIAGNRLSIAEEDMRKVLRALRYDEDNDTLVDELEKAYPQLVVTLKIGDKLKNKDGIEYFIASDDDDTIAFFNAVTFKRASGWTHVKNHNSIKVSEVVDELEEVEIEL